MGEIMTFEPTEAQFGVFWKYLQRPNVTDVVYKSICPMHLSALLRTIFPTA